MAARRLEQEVLPLFDAPAPATRQAEIGDSP
jgi:hypothetical protein